MKIKSFIAAAAAVGFSFSVAEAAVFSFGGNGGSSLGKTEVFSADGGPETVVVTAINTEQSNRFERPRLHQTSSGLGVSLLFNDGGSLFPPVPSTELDNVGDDEAIVFDFGEIVTMDSVTIAAADLTDTVRFYGTNDPTVTSISSGGLSALTSISTFITGGNGNFFAVPEAVDLLGATFRYLIATVPAGSGDGYRVLSATVSEVPLPGALPFMLTALAGYGAMRRKRQAV